MVEASDDLPVLAFRSAGDLREWLMANHETSRGIWIRLCRKNSGVPSVSFEELLDEGLCFGWSESTRRRGDDHCYLQRFTPRRKKGTASQRNLKHAEQLVNEGRMLPAGLKALGMESAQ